MRTAARKSKTPSGLLTPSGNERRLVTQHPRRRILSLAAGAAALPAAGRIAWAQSYPSRPITLVVPFASGGGSDVIGRIMAERMRATLGQPVIVENVTGANGSIGAGRVARAAPDGYTFVIGAWGTHVTNGALYSLSYDTLNDFQPIALVTSQPYLIVTRKTLPADDLSGVIAWLKANPDKASAGIAGVGNASHVSAIFFQKATDTRFQFVPYRGGAPALQDLVGGQIDLMMAALGDCAELVRAGTIRAHAIAAKNRSTAVPNVPTVDEAGLPGFHFSVWFGLWAPARTPKDVITRLNASAVDALADPRVRARLADLGQDIFAADQLTPEALGALQKAEIEKWWPIIKAANIKGE